MPIISGSEAATGGSSSPFAAATVTLTNAQIKTLPTTPIELVAAAGAGKVIVPVLVWLHLTWAADYTNISSTATVGVEWGTTTLTSSVAALKEASVSEVSNLLADGASHAAWLPAMSHANGATALVSGIGQTVDDPDPIDAALNIYATNDTGAFTGGAAGNSLKVTVYYATFTN